MVALLHQGLGSELMLVWGWRVPFLISALPSALAIWGRMRIPETDVFLSEVREKMEKQNQQDAHEGLRELLTHYPVVLLIGIGGVCATATMWYAPPFWTLTAVLWQLDPSDTLWVGTSCQLVAIAVTPVAGWFTDRYGAMTALVGAIYATLVAFPAYLWLIHVGTRSQPWNCLSRRGFLLRNCTGLHGCEHQFVLCQPLSSASLVPGDGTQLQHWCQLLGRLCGLDLSSIVSG